MSGRGDFDRSTNRRFPEDSRSRQNSSSSSGAGEHRDFQFGKDRAPPSIDPQFLIRIGAKRLNNGTLVDRNGHELKTRDPDCQAPSPPSYNPGREARKSKNTEIDSLSQEELDKKARQQIEMMKKMQKEEEKQKKKKEKEQKNDEEEGEDEYDEVEPEPEEAKPVLEPESAKEEVQQKRQRVQRSNEQNWYMQYKKQVETLREKVYGNYHGPSSTSAPQTGYFFRAPPAVPSVPIVPQSVPQASSWMPPPSVHQMDLPPRQVDLPPPGIIPEALFPPSETPESVSNPYGVRRGIEVGRVIPEALFPPSETPEAISNQYGIRRDMEPRPDSPDSDDEAIHKLRDIIKHYGR